MSLNLKPNIDKPDDFYEQLINLQDGLNEEQIQLMNAKLILVLANHIGDRNILNEAFNLISKN